MQKTIKYSLILVVMFMVLASCSRTELPESLPGTDSPYSITEAEAYYKSVLSQSATDASVFFTIDDMTPLWKEAEIVSTDTYVKTLTIPVLSPVTYYVVPKDAEDLRAERIPCTRTLVLHYDLSVGFDSVSVRYTFGEHSFYVSPDGNVTDPNEILTSYDFKKGLKLPKSGLTKAPDSEEIALGGGCPWIEDVVIIADNPTTPTIPATPVINLGDYYGDPRDEDERKKEKYDGENFSFATFVAFLNFSSDAAAVAKAANKVFPGKIGTVEHSHLLTYDRQKAFVGYEKGKRDCMAVAKALLKHFGLQTSDYSPYTNIVYTDNQGNKTTLTCDKYWDRVSSMINNLDNNRPVVIGVNHNYFDSSELSSNTNRGTQHFVVVTGYEQLSDGAYIFRFVETGREAQYWETATGNGQYNILYCNPDTQEFYGDGHMRDYLPYNVTEIRDTYSL